VFATGPGIAGLKPAKAMDKSNKNLQHVFLRMGSKTVIKFLQNLKKSLRSVNKKHVWQNSHFFYPFLLLATR
jgi:hypothetical protein